MNYRHVYHAGNFADCFKHALLAALVDSFTRKPAPFFVLDTHAGTGLYDLNSDEARRTGEAETGIRRLLASRPTALLRYLELVEQRGLYPGSPLLISAILRDADRLACCELHPDDKVPLRRLFRHDGRVEVHHRSGWEAIGALLPPKERRGLIFIDPPFEDPEEFSVLADGLIRGHRRFSQGVFAAWYPIKQRAAVRMFHATMKTSGIRDIIAIELHLRDTLSADRLNGCGLLVINPPYLFADESARITEAVLDGLGPREDGAGIDLIRIADES